MRGHFIDRCSFQHKITGAKSPTNPDTLGGILADEMGMGKTLSVLSAIIDSLDDAQVFSKSGGQNNIMSTLIIVPSECMLPNSTCCVSAYTAHSSQYYCIHGHAKLVGKSLTFSHQYRRTLIYISPLGISALGLSNVLLTTAIAARTTTQQLEDTILCLQHMVQPW